MGEKINIRRALISVSNKEGIVQLANMLVNVGAEILSTGGTFKLLRENKIPAREVSEHTGFPEMMDGRVKTLHPKIHGGLLALRGNADHEKQMKEHEIAPIDMVVCNLYPFSSTVNKPGVRLEDAIENIDIGGPSMIRSGAKNHVSVAVICNPADYGQIIEELRANNGALSLETRRALAVSAYAHTAEYDRMISQWFAKTYNRENAIPLTLSFGNRKTLRYGENPHQSGVLFADTNSDELSVAKAEVLGGKELSYNNILDLDSALLLVREFEKPAVVIVKHNNPCGCSEDDNLVRAFEKAWEGDPLSAYGSILAINRTVNEDLAEAIVSSGRFVEAIIATDFSNTAQDILQTRKKWGKNLRLLRCGPIQPNSAIREKDLRKIIGGILVQDRDTKLFGEEVKCVTNPNPSDAARRDLDFAWKIVKHAKSNAISIAKDGMLLGLGAGQTSRVDSVQIAIKKSGDKIKGAVLASDAFFPFRDSIDALAPYDIKGIIQPGGSIRDEEVIQAANEHGIPMLFTGMRHFRH